MRLRITFRLPVPNTRIPLAYNTLLSAALCEWLGVPPVDRHNPAAYFDQKAALDRFVFSRLLIKSKLVDLKSSTIKILSPSALLYLGVAENHDELSTITARLVGRECPMGKEGQPLIIEKTDPLPAPVSSRRMNFRMLSPAAIPGADGTWLAADHPDTSESIRKILLDRHRSLFNTVPLEDDELVATADPAYLGLRGGGGGVVKRVRLTGADPGDPFLEVQGFICPITLRGNPRLIGLAYDCGLGAMNMFGFGMIG